MTYRIFRICRFWKNQPSFNPILVFFTVFESGIFFGFLEHKNHEICGFKKITYNRVGTFSIELWKT